MEFFLDIESGLSLLPAQLVRQPDILDKLNQLQICRQNDVIETVPVETAEIVPCSQTAQLALPLDDVDLVAVANQPMR